MGGNLFLIELEHCSTWKVKYYFIAEDQAGTRLCFADDEQAFPVEIGNLQVSMAVMFFQFAKYQLQTSQSECRVIPVLRSDDRTLTAASLFDHALGNDFHAPLAAQGSEAAGGKRSSHRGMADRARGQPPFMLAGLLAFLSSC